MRRFTIPTSLVAIILSGGAAYAADLTADWKVDGDVAGNAIALVCSLKQEDAKLSGECVSAAGGAGIDAPVTGKVDGKNVSFQFDFEYSGMALTMAFSGTNDTESSMKGGIQVSGAEGTFSAVKQVPAR
jgi:hypothetical protein